MMLRGIIAVLGLLLLMGCQEEWKEDPLDSIIKKMENESQFSVLLQDMDMRDDAFYHRYKVIRLKDSIPVDSLTDWMRVSEEQFFQYENDLGMEILTKDSNGVHRSVAPPGYNHYVGNDRYGEWRRDTHGNTFWHFYGQYMFMRSMLGLAGYPVYYNGYRNYYTNYRYRTNYYGATPGRYDWGTRSSYTREKRKDFFDRKVRKNNFKRSRTTSSWGGRGRGGFGK